jgi:putative hydrolase of the HAD superfamily
VRQRAILFDLDDTLLDRRQSIELFLAGQYSRFRERFLPHRFPAVETLFFELDDHGGARRVDVYRQLVEDLQLDLDPQVLVDDFHAKAWNNCQLLPDADMILHHFSELGWKLGLITNGSVGFQVPKIRAAGLIDRFQAICISGREGVRKPDPEIFRRACSRLEVEPEDCVFVGDNPFADIAGSKRIGMRAVWYRRFHHWPTYLDCQPDAVIGGLRQLREISFLQPIDRTQPA